MKVKTLAALLATWPQDAEVLVRLDGSIFSTDTDQAHQDYNDLDTQEDPDAPEFFILANEEQ